MLDPWKDPQFRELDDRLRVSYLWLATSPWPLPGVFSLPKKLPTEYIGEPELDSLVLIRMVYMDHRVVYVPGCIPRLPETGVKVNSLRKRLEKIPDVKPRQMWLEELRKLYDAKRGKFTDADHRLGQVIFGEDPISSDFDKCLGDSEIQWESRKLVIHFKERHEALGLGVYVYNLSQEMRLAKELLKDLNYDDLVGRIEAFLSDRWFIAKKLTNFQTFRRNVNRFTSTKSMTGETQELSGYKQFVDRFF